MKAHVVRSVCRWAFPVLIVLALASAGPVRGNDWPQWLGPNRDGKAAGFIAPKEWPKELTKKWKVTVGDGVATPALVGDKLYVFSRQGDSEVVRCLEAATGKEVWQDKYETGGATGPASGFAGPRSSPTVADGKILTLGVRGILTCYDAATGKKLWRKDDIKAVPTFFTSSSPLVVDGLCLVQLGGQRDGVVVALDLASGTEKWKWAGDGTAYASPVLLTVDGTKMLVVETQQNIAGVGVADGKLLWKTPFAVTGRGYNASTPMVDGPTVVFSGSSRGTKAMKIEKKDGAFEAKEVWKNGDNSVMYNTPIVRGGLVFGLTSGNSLFCLDAQTGKTAWSSAINGRQGYGSIVDAGAVLMALTPSAELIVYEPIDKEFKKLAGYKVADRGTYAYPVVSGNRVFVKDQDSVTLWTIE